MSLNFDALGIENAAADASWDHRDAIIYALGVGAGQDDPLSELHLTTENSEGIAQQVLPGFGVVRAMSNSPKPSLGDFHLSAVLHAEQSFVVHRPLATAMRATTSMTLTGMYDKGKAGLITSDSVLRDADTGEPLLTSTGGLFVKGEGGFGGEKQPVREWPEPTAAADLEVCAHVRPDQTLLYRLSGDRNPLHSDPLFAQKAGFDRPILHGMCTYGTTARLLAGALCDGDQHQVRSMYGRFSKPVMPGETLIVRIWADRSKGTAQFRTFDASGDVVLDRGTFTWQTTEESR